MFHPTAFPSFVTPLALAALAIAQQPNLLVDGQPGPGSSARSDQSLWIHPSGQFALAMLEDGTGGEEVWRTDGTAAGTRLLFDHSVSPAQLGIAPIAGTIDDQFWFVDLVGPFGPPPSLWRTDGRSSLPVRVIDGAIAGIAEFGVGGVAWDDHAFCFVRSAQNAPWELWRIDRHGQRATIWTDSPAASAIAQPFILDAWGGTALFLTALGELHVTDGNPVGTIRISQGAATYVGRGLGGYQIHEPVTLPGPTAGTRISIVRDGVVAQSFTFPTQRLVAHGLGDELWVLLDDRDLSIIDGTGTSRPIATFVPGAGTEFRNLIGLVDLGDRKLFFADGGNGAGRELWRSDGTAAGTAMVVDLASGPADLPLDSVAQVAQRMIFWATIPGLGSEPWVSDGTLAGTGLLGDLEPGAGSSAMVYMFWPTLDSVLLAVTTSAHGREPWISDGTAAGTRLLADIRPGPDSSLSIDPFSALLFGSVVGDRAVFPADDGGHGLELWSVSLPTYCMPVASLECARGADLAIRGWPRLGGSIEPAMRGLAANDRGALLASLPAASPLLRVQGCGLHLDPAALVSLGTVVSNGGGGWSLSLPIPNQTALIGLQFGVQAVMLDAGAPIGLRPSRPWRITLGR